MISIVIPTMNRGRIAFRAGLRIAGWHSSDLTSGIAEICGMRYGLRIHDRIARVVSEQVSRGRGVMVRMAVFLAGFVCALYRHLAGIGCVDRWWLGVE